MGVHSTFLKIATIAIGTYVNIKSGKVKVYNIFFKLEQFMLFHSVIVVISPIIYKNTYENIMSQKNAIKDSANSSLEAAINTAKNTLATTATRLNTVTKIAGKIVINISKHEKLNFVKRFLTRDSPYFPST